MRKICFLILIVFTFFIYGLAAEDQLIIIKHNGLKGIIDKNFKIIAFPSFEVILQYSGDCAVAYNVPAEDAYIFSGGEKQKIDGRYYSGHVFSDYFLFSYPDIKGKTMVNCKTLNRVYSDWGIYESSQPIIPVRGTDGFYYIDTDGNILFNGRKFNEAFGFVEGYAVVALSDWSYVIMDDTGKTTENIKFEITSKYFSEGLIAGITKDGKTGFFDVDGKQVIDIPFRYYGLRLATTDFNGGYALVNVADNRWRIIDRTGKNVKEISCLYADNFCDGLSRIVVSSDDGDKYRFVRTDGTFLTSLEFDEASSFCNGYARIVVNGIDGLLDTDGNIYLSNELLQGKKIRHTESEFYENK